MVSTSNLMLSQECKGGNSAGGEKSALHSLAGF
jgi:hypothetical protein